MVSKIGRNNLAICYRYGRGTDIDKNKAFECYQKLAENENEIAQYNLGFFCEKGIGTKKDLKKAFYWYQKSAKNENEVAQYNLGYFYNHGIGIGKNLEKAFYWYQKSAENGNKIAQYNLIDYYENGIGEDLEKASYWYQKSIENKNKSERYIGKYEADNQSNNTIEFINKVLKNKVKFIPFDELIDSEPLDEGGFGSITKATWLKTNNYVVYKKLINNVTAFKGNTLDAFINELKIHLLLNYSNQIIRFLGISQGNLIKFYFFKKIYYYLIFKKFFYRSKYKRIYSCNGIC